jgi:hypothetical protein
MDLNIPESWPLNSGASFGAGNYPKQYKPV